VVAGIQVLWPAHCNGKGQEMIHLRNHSAESELLVSGNKALNDEETHGIRLLLLAVIFIGVVSVVAPAIPVRWKAETSFLPPLLIGLIALVVIFNLRVASQKKTLRRVSDALIAADSYIERLEQFSLLDPRTQLFNRRYLDQLFSHQSSAINRSGRAATFVLIAVRPDEERPASDEVLTKAAFVVRSNFRGSDVIVRCAPDQFLIVMPDTDEAQAQIALNRLADKVEFWNLENENVEMALRYERVLCTPGANLWERLNGMEEKLKSSQNPTVARLPWTRPAERRGRPDTSTRLV